MFEKLKQFSQEVQKRAEEARARDKANAREQASASQSKELDMATVAREFAENLGQAGVTLDFTPASLVRIDGLIAAMLKKFPAANLPEGKEKRARACINLGAYVGEVLRLHEGGVWVKGDDQVHVLDLGGLAAPVIQAMFGFLTDGRVAMPGGTADTVVSYYEQVSRANGSWLETTVRGQHSDMESLQREMSADAKLAGWLAAQAQIAVKTARTKWSVALDFTADSLKLVEAVLGQLHDMAKAAAPADRPTEKQIEGASIVWGVYVGEVIRRHYGGQWEVSKPDGILQLKIKEARLFPVRKVQKRLVDGPGDNVAFYFHAMKQVLDETGSKSAAR
jgi:hypothetical protein